jgi:hypothetical protein
MLRARPTANAEKKRTFMETPEGRAGDPISIDVRKLGEDDGTRAN